LNHTYASVFSSELNRYMGLMGEKGLNTKTTRNTLTRFDLYLTRKNWNQKNLPASSISEWLTIQNTRASTKRIYLMQISGFVRYLRSLDISADCPELPKINSDYAAYLFSDEELARIFLLADNYGGSRRFSRRTFAFPIILRILYGCGLRIGEVCSLQWKDVDLEQGVITIRYAKNEKQRVIPMHASLTRILKEYHCMARREKICAGYLFESAYNPGNPMDTGSFHKWFRIILQKSGIEYTKNDPNERGPCPHCLRHTFVMKSFQKSEDEGKRFEDTAPFLAAYLGHDGPQNTETYLSSNHSLYTQSHKRVDAAIGNLFPEVCFDEE